MKYRVDDITINTFIGSGSVVSGDIKVNGFVRVDGDIDGNFETNGSVIIGEKARIHGNVTAKVAIIGGLVIGNVSASESVKLLSTSAVIGDVVTRHIQIDDKVVFHGHCIAVSDENSFNEKSTEYLDSAAVRSKVLL